MTIVVSPSFQADTDGDSSTSTKTVVVAANSMTSTLLSSLVTEKLKTITSSKNNNTNFTTSCDTMTMTASSTSTSPSVVVEDLPTSRTSGGEQQDDNEYNAFNSNHRSKSRLLDVLMAARALSCISGAAGDDVPAVPSSSMNTSSDDDNNKDANTNAEEQQQQEQQQEHQSNQDQEDENGTPMAIDKEDEPQTTMTNEEPLADAGGDNGETTPTAIKTFPEKLMEMLDQEEDVSDVLTWLPGGKSFTILKPEKFTKEVLPKFFKQSKFESFVRKLYRWGFRQVDSTSTKGATAAPQNQVTFYHKYFQKGNVALAVQKLRSVTPSKLSNAAHRAAVKQERNSTNRSRPSSSVSSSNHGVGGGSFKLFHAPSEGPMLPASTQSLLAQLRKERGLGMSTTATAGLNKSILTSSGGASSGGTSIMSDVERLLKMSMLSSSNANASNHDFSSSSSTLAALVAAQQQQRLLRQQQQQQQLLSSLNGGASSISTLPTFATSSASGGSMATRMILKRLQAANAVAALSSASSGLVTAPTSSVPSSAGSNSANNDRLSALLEHQKSLAQMQAAATVARLQQQQQQQQHQQQVLLQKNTSTSSSSQSQWQEQLRQVLGRHRNRANASALGLGGNDDGFAVTKPTTLLPSFPTKNHPDQSLELLLNKQKNQLFQNLPAAQPSYGKDIVKAAVDALNNAS